MFNWFKRSSKSAAADRPARSNGQRPRTAPHPDAAADRHHRGSAPLREQAAAVATSDPTGTPWAPAAPAASETPGAAAAPSAGRADKRPRHHTVGAVGAGDVRAAGVTVESPPVLARLAASHQQLSPHAQRILARLPPEARLDIASARFPHAVESLLRHWSRPEAFRQALDALMIDTRGNRQGFPFEVMMEFTALRDYYEARVVPNETRLWDKTDVR